MAVSPRSQCPPFQSQSQRSRSRNIAGSPRESNLCHVADYACSGTQLANASIRIQHVSGAAARERRHSLRYTLKNVLAMCTHLFNALQVGALEETIACGELSYACQPFMTWISFGAGEYSHLKVDCTLSPWTGWQKPYSILKSKQV